jgi:hypothetical protein
MIPDLSPLQVLLVTLSGWVNRQQQHVIEYLSWSETSSGRTFAACDSGRHQLARRLRRLGSRSPDRSGETKTFDDGVGNARERAMAERPPRSGDALVAVMEPANFGNGADRAV